MNKYLLLLSQLFFCLRPFQKIKIQTKLAWFLVFGFLPLLSGCNYYRINKTEPVSEARLSAIPNYTRLLVYQGNDVWELKNVQVKEQALKGTLQAVSNELKAYINPSATAPNRYRSWDKMLAFNVVHLHISEYAKGEGNTVIIPVGAIKQMYTPVQDQSTTTASHLLGSMGVVAGTFLLWAAFLILTWGH